MGLEPTTFCMASRRSSQLSYIRAGRSIAAEKREQSAAVNAFLVFIAVMLVAAVVVLGTAAFVLHWIGASEAVAGIVLALLGALLSTPFVATPIKDAERDDAK